MDRAMGYSLSQRIIIMVFTTPNPYCRTAASPQSIGKMTMITVQNRWSCSPGPKFKRRLHQKASTRLVSSDRRHGGTDRKEGEFPCIPGEIHRD